MTLADPGGELEQRGRPAWQPGHGQRLNACLPQPHCLPLRKPVQLQTNTPPTLLLQVAAESLEYAAERLAQVQTVQVFAQERREAAAFSQLSQSGYEMARKYAVFQVS